MKDRILKILNELGLSSTKLAEEIGVQKSSISHIVSGRNKPSFDFIQKLLKRYPEINPKYILLGEGNLFISERQSELPFEYSEKQKDKQTTSRESNISATPLPNDQIEKSQSLKPESIKEKKIQRIVIFYEDNSFEEYLPKENK